MKRKPMSFGDFIKHKRLEREKIQGEVAKALDLSISYYSEVERGVKLPFTPDKIEMFAKYLRLTKEEKAQMYDLASCENNEIPADIANTFLYTDFGDVMRFAFREFQAGNLEEDDVKQLIRKAEENKNRNKGDTGE